ncbi:hypothetical protein C7H83_02285 [Tetragenococcus halophilus]|uniref:Type VII secretion protein EssA n=1 Tax=Tetragenococcus halophilus TaxID=51669 RepID=A0A3G5FGC6_TETHA|nr:hypothetical protein [Tetragenococcus halophilus]AYW49396.1 hypothetical protein C7H83_02285 [Tetragenococcus halophilus]GBD62689.1 putative uncharacterized protein [Tetragenococcus halophilus subsp. flandriensis]GFK23350.1 hypothetical protein YA163_04130 [Tetragenococcus halophilus]
MKIKQKLFATIYLFFLCMFTFSVTASAQEIDTNSVNNQSDLILTNLTSSETSQKATEAQLLDNPVVTFLLEHLKINKPTVFAIGITTIGIIFLFMSLFLPSLAKQEKMRQRSNQPTSANRHGNRRKKVSKKGIIAVLGLIFVLIGVVVQTINQIS